MRDNDTIRRGDFRTDDEMWTAEAMTPERCAKRRAEQLGQLDDDERAALAGLIAAQEKGEYTWCPRCGRDTMGQDIGANGMSLCLDLRVCPDCAKKERELAMMNADSSPKDWAAMPNAKAGGSFENMPVRQAERFIRVTQGRRIQELYMLWASGDVETDVYSEARKSLPGLSFVWLKGSFELRYRCFENRTVRFWCTGAETGRPALLSEIMPEIPDEE